MDGDRNFGIRARRRDHRDSRYCVPLPAGARWYDWFDPTVVHDGGQTLTSYDSTARDRLPLFVREGAIIEIRAIAHRRP